MLVGPPKMDGSWWRGLTDFGPLEKGMANHFMRFSRQEYWNGLQFPFPLHHILSDLSIMTRPSWVAPWAWLSFIELDRQGCGPSVIRLTNFLWVWFHCVCPLMPSCNTYHLTVGYLFTAAPAKRSHCSLPWTRGISSPLPFLTFNVVFLLYWLCQSLWLCGSQ